MVCANGTFDTNPMEKEQRSWWHWLVVYTPVRVWKCRRNCKQLHCWPVFKSVSLQANNAVAFD